MTDFLHGNEDYYEGRPSKSQRKRDMVALQKLGEQLLELAPEQLERMALPDPLVEALRFYHTLKDKEAKRRHLQFIGTVMRKVDSEPIHQAMAELDQLRYQQAEAFHQLEEWRDRLVAGEEDLLEELVLRFGLDRPKVRQLVRGAAAERTEGKPPKQGRALFRLLRQSMEKEDN